MVKEVELATPEPWCELGTNWAPVVRRRRRNSEVERGLSRTILLVHGSNYVLFKLVP